MRMFLLALLLLGCSDETISGYADREAVYKLIELDEQPFTADATIAFPEPGRAEGRGPCNTWSAEQKVPYPWFELGPIAATRRACPDLAAESAYFQALGRITLAEVLGPVLILSDDSGPVLFFRAE